MRPRHTALALAAILNAGIVLQASTISAALILFVALAVVEVLLVAFLVVCAAAGM